MTYVITGARDYNQTVNLGESVVFDASSSVDDEEIISYRWDFGDGTNGSGKIVSHSYAEAETYQITLNVTDNHGLSSIETLTINISAPEYIPLVIRVVLLVMTGLLSLIFIILFLRRRSNGEKSDAAAQASFPKIGECAERANCIVSDSQPPGAP